MNKDPQPQETEQNSDIIIPDGPYDDETYTIQADSLANSYILPWEANANGYFLITQLPLYAAAFTARLPLSKDSMRLMQKKIPVPSREKGCFKLTKGTCRFFDSVFLEMKRLRWGDNNVNTVLIDTFWKVVTTSLVKEISFDIEHLQQKEFKAVLEELQAVTDKHPGWRIPLAQLILMYADYKKLENVFTSPEMDVFKKRYILFGLYDSFSFGKTEISEERLFSTSPLNEEETTEFYRKVALIFLSHRVKYPGGEFEYNWKELEDLTGIEIDVLTEAFKEKMALSRQRRGKAEANADASDVKQTQNEDKKESEVAATEEPQLNSEEDAVKLEPDVNENKEEKPSEEVKAGAKAGDELLDKASIQKAIREYLNENPGRRTALVERVPKEPAGEGTLYTGFLNIYESGTTTFLNFYPKFVWEDGKPVALSEERLSYEFPDFGSLNITRTKGDRRRLPFLQSGSLINVRIREELIANFSETRKHTHFSISLSELMKKGDICLSSDAEPDYQAFFIARKTEEKGGGTYAIQTPSGDQYSKEITNPLVMVETSKNQFMGPVRLIKETDTSFKVQKEIARTGLEIKHRFTVKNAEAISFFVQHSPGEWTTSYEILFTGPRFCTEYLIDDSDDVSGAEDLLAASNKKENALKTIQSGVDQLKELYPENSELSDIVQARLNSILLASSNYRKQDKFFKILTAIVLTRWSEMTRTENSRCDALLESVFSSEKALERLLELPGVASEISRAKQKLEEQNKNLEKELSEKQQAAADLNKQVAELTQKFSALSSLKEIEEELETKKTERVKLEEEIRALHKQYKQAEQEFEAFDETLNRYENRMTQVRAKAAELYMDREISHMIFKDQGDNGTTQGSEPKKDNWSEKHSALAQVRTEFTRQEELVAGLVDRIHRGREYSENEIINILTCISTGFLTVFAGAPGSGKTTLSDLIGTAFGLNSLENHPAVRKVWKESSENANRYLSVAVERGWTSKRDFIGYYNPINNSFECGDPQRYEFLRTLDQEARSGRMNLPYFVLLDEANLSPMEYYFADFMNIGEGRGHDSFVALGDHHRYKIGSNLRFIATINTDHTTERLSPRLLDRSWIVTLPESRGLENVRSGTVSEPSMPIDWELFLKAFSSSGDSAGEKRRQKILSEISTLLEAVKNRVSHRSRRAVLDYTGAAVRWMNGVNSEEVEMTALDYAVSQRLLPQTDVFGNFETELETLQKYFEERGMRLSAAVVERILSSGEELKGFSFF